jgi:hypothetical protein
MLQAISRGLMRWQRVVFHLRPASVRHSPAGARWQALKNGEMVEWVWSMAVEGIWQL